METKKISFGFSKITKKLNVLPSKLPKEESKVELIKCLEGQEIKLVEEKPEVAPLVIPLKENQKTSAALASLIKRRAVLLGEDEEPQAAESEVVNGAAAPSVSATNGVTENLEQRAARELLAELQANGEPAENSNLVLPIVKPDELPLDGAKESTLDDYDSIPVQEFGTALLRGMGWVEPPKKKGGGPLVDEGPIVRPKGMGLGADKALKAKPLLVAPEANEVLEIKKLAFIRILGGKHKDLYGQIEGFDDHAGRVIVKMAIGGMKEAFNEFLCQPVSKKEYAQYGKCINTTKYEEYKKMENEYGQIIIKKEERDDKRTVKKHSPDTQNNEHHRQRDAKDHYDGKEHRVKEERVGETKRRDERSERIIKEEKHMRRYDDDNGSRNSSTSRRHRDDHVDARYDNRDSKHLTERKEKYRSRSTERRRENDRRSELHKSQSSSSRRRQDIPQILSSSDTSESSDSDSGSDSAYERKDRKKSSKKSKSKKKSKKSKSKSRHRRPSPSSEDATDSMSDGERRSSKNHKKKTKKSKKPRSRSRSRGRR